MLKKLLLCVLIAVIALSCEDSDDNGFETTIYQSWKLKQLSCNCGYKEGYDFTQNTMTINSNNTADFNSELSPAFEKGSFEFEVTADSIFFGNYKYAYRFEKNKLILNTQGSANVADDEFNFVYIKQ
ncbi:hypothetical protein ACG2LH_00395 [Zhouia sp. PK063]|uniref:hypothetical protein n=1 Tax=Zhouia sp. PK063 TaxID=3373602 RepID=UPI0037B739DB